MKRCAVAWRSLRRCPRSASPLMMAAVPDPGATTRSAPLLGVPVKTCACWQKRKAQEHVKGKHNAHKRDARVPADNVLPHCRWPRTWRALSFIRKNFPNSRSTANKQKQSYTYRRCHPHSSSLTQEDLRENPSSRGKCTWQWAGSPVAHPSSSADAMSSW